MVADDRSQSIRNEGGMMNRFAAVLGFLAVFVGSAACAQDKGGTGGDAGHVIVRADAIKWAPAPPGLPPGSQLHVLVGDPGKVGPFVLRARMPDGYKVPPHWHPGEESVTVLKGAMLIGMGEKFDRPKMEQLAAGSFVHMPKGMRHYVVAKGKTVIQVHGIGPFDITYVNPADDPRKKETKK
jgi:quercetin dioxygenase-like cupin family protein